MLTRFSMIKYMHKFTIAMILCLMITSSDVGANELNRLDIKKSSSSASTVNVTIYTSNPYDDNVAVTKKGDNKYVILLPKVSGANSANVDYSALKDVISDVNVKSVNDGAEGYTKITLTTTKPISVSTSTRKSAPLTAEQKAYKNLIAQTRAASLKANKPEETKSETNVSAPAKPTDDKNLKKSKSNIKTPTALPNDKKENNVKSVTKSVEPSKKQKVKPAEKVVETTKKQADKQITANKKTAQKDNTLKELQNEVKSETSIQEKPRQNTVEASAQTQKESATTAASKTVENNIPQQLPKEKSQPNVFLIFSVLAGGVLGLVLLMKFIKTLALIQEQARLVSSQNGIYGVSTSVSNTPNENHYKNWQEKYTNYVKEMSENTDERLEYLGDGEYRVVNSVETPKETLEQEIQATSKVVKKSAQSALPKIEPDRLRAFDKPANGSEKFPRIKKSKPRKHKKIEIVEATLSVQDIKKHRKELEEVLEKTLHNSPSTERLPIDETVVDNVEKDFEKAKLNKTPAVNTAPVVKKEEEQISQTVRKSPKLKAFAPKMTLDKSSRSTSSKQRHSEEIRRDTAEESAYVNLQNSGLYRNTRNSFDKDLSIADLISRSVSKARKHTQNSAETYATVTVDEFFDTGYNSTASYSTSSKVANRLEKISAGFRNKSVIQPKQEPKTPEIIKQEEPKRETYTTIKVRSAYNINKNSGFYVVDDENGNSSLIGVVNNNVPLIKSFGKMADTSLKVINQDEQDVYMVKANNERFLVEAGEEKVGVLLKL